MGVPQLSDVHSAIPDRAAFDGLGSTVTGCQNGCMVTGGDVSISKPKPNLGYVVYGVLQGGWAARITDYWAGRITDYCRMTAKYSNDLETLG